MSQDLHNIDTLDASPFRHFITTIGNLPTSFTDSMSYYEMLAWFCDYLQNTVIPAINNNASALEELQNLYIALHDYVEHYFDNLDVQEEINNKIDDMVENGEFQSILDNYVTPTLNQMRTDLEGEINTKTANLQAQISGLASGTPLVATSTAGMTDTSKVYVNTTDGNWYYYDGDSWEIGGTYQTAGIADDSIEGQMIKDNTITPYSLIGIPRQPTQSVFRFAKWHVGYRWFNGSMAAAEGYVSSEMMPVYAANGITYTPKQNMVSPERVVKFNSDGEFVSEAAITTSGWTPTGLGYVAITLKIENFDRDFITASTGNNYIDVSWIKQEGLLDKNMLVYGDSLWANCEGNFNYTNTPYHTSTDPCYGYKQYLEAIGIKCDNQAVSGQTVVGCWGHAGDKFPQTISALTLANYDGVIISFGRNDFRTSVPMGTLGNPSDTSFDTTTFYGCYRSIISTLLDKNPKLKIYLWGMTQSNANGYGTETVNSEGLKEIDYVNALKNLGEMYSCPVIDLYRYTGINELTLPEWTFEGVHLTNEGYELASQYFVNEMKNNC